MSREMLGRIRGGVYHLTDEQLKAGMKRLAHVLHALAVMGENDTEQEVMQVVGLEMDEAFWRRLGKHI